MVELCELCSKVAATAHVYEHTGALTESIKAACTPCSDKFIAQAAVR